MRYEKLLGGLSMEHGNRFLTRIYDPKEIEQFNKRSKGAKPSEKIKPQNSVRNLFFSINKYIK